VYTLIDIFVEPVDKLEIESIHSVVLVVASLIAIGVISFISITVFTLIHFTYFILLDNSIIGLTCHLVFRYFITWGTIFTRLALIVLLLSSIRVTPVV
jgi:hypothetical protein